MNEHDYTSVSHFGMFPVLAEPETAPMPERAFKSGLYPTIITSKPSIRIEA